MVETNENYAVADMNLAEKGLKRIEWAEDHMPVLMSIKKKHEEQKPLAGIRIGGAIHVTKETAVLVRTLRALGAEVSWAGCNPLSTQDDVAAQLAKEGVKIYAWHANDEKYYWCLDKVLDTKPHFTMDDGGDLVFRYYDKHKDKLQIKAGTEETSTGVIRFVNMAKDGLLPYPIIAVNNAETKWDFDNIYGTGQGAIDGLLRSSSVLIAGKNFVVSGYGHCGKGTAIRAKGMGAKVIITEVNPINALKATMDGFQVMSMKDAVKIGDIFITSTGCKDIISKEHFPLLKDGAILGNVGHFNVEIRVDQLDEYAIRKREIRTDLEEYTFPDGKKAYLVAQGRLANLAAAEGHPSEVMDMSFSNQVMCILRLAKEADKMDKKVYEISKEQDMEIAKLKLKSMEIEIDTLSEEQIKYNESYAEGT